MNYTYKMVQIPPSVEVKKGESNTGAAAYLQSIVNHEAKQNWEFYRVDEIGVSENPGCLLGFLGARGPIQLYYVVTFRKPA